MSGDLRTAVEGLDTHEGHAYEPGIEWLCVPTGLDHPPYSKDCGNPDAHYRLIDRADVLALIPEGAVLVTEDEYKPFAELTFDEQRARMARLHEEWAAALDDHELMTNPAECSCGDWTYRDEGPGNYFRDHQAAAILCHLRKGT